MAEIEVAEAGIADESDTRADQGIREAVEDVNRGERRDEVRTEVFPAEGEGIGGSLSGSVKVGVVSLFWFGGGGAGGVGLEGDFAVKGEWADGRGGADAVGIVADVACVCGGFIKIHEVGVAGDGGVARALVGGIEKVDVAGEISERTGPNGDGSLAADVADRLGSDAEVADAVLHRMAEGFDDVAMVAAREAQRRNDLAILATTTVDVPWLPGDIHDLEGLGLLARHLRGRADAPESPG